MKKHPVISPFVAVFLTALCLTATLFGTPRFPLSDVPLQTLANDVAVGRYGAKPVRVFRFEETREAHKLMESGLAGGKIVVSL